MNEMGYDFMLDSISCYVFILVLPINIVFVSNSHYTGGEREKTSIYFCCEERTLPPQTIDMDNLLLRPRAFLTKELKMGSLASARPFAFK